MVPLPRRVEQEERTKVAAVGEARTHFRGVRDEAMARLTGKYNPSNPEFVADMASRKISLDDLPDNAVTARQWGEYYGLTGPTVVVRINKGRIPKAQKIKSQWFIVVSRWLFKRMTK